jgi:hypothetical protein
MRYRSMTRDSENLVRLKFAISEPEATGERVARRAQIEEIIRGFRFVTAVFWPTEYDSDLKVIAMEQPRKDSKSRARSRAQTILEAIQAETSPLEEGVLQQPSQVASNESVDAKSVGKRYRNIPPHLRS